ALHRICRTRHNGLQSDTHLHSDVYGIDAVVWIGGMSAFTMNGDFKICASSHCRSAANPDFSDPQPFARIAVKSEYRIDGRIFKTGFLTQSPGSGTELL